MTEAAAAPAPAAPAVSSTAAALAPAPAPAPAGDVPAQVAAAAAAAQGQVPAGETIAWLPDAAPELVGYVKNKGWTDPKQVLEGYQNLEKLRGVPAERLLTLPAADADEAAKGAFFEKLGRPKDVAGYEFKLEGEANAPFDSGIKESFLKHGITAEQAKGVMADYAAIAESQTKAQQAAIAERTNAEHIELMREWGAAANQNLGLAGKGKELLGWSDEMVDAIGATVGHKQTLKMLADIAARAGEAPLVTDGGAQGYGNVMTPAQAKAKMAELQADPGFRQKILSGDAAALAERRRLIAFAEAGK